MLYLGLKGAAATAGFYSVRVDEREALFLEAFVPIDGGAVQVQSAFFVDNHSDTVALVFAVGLFIKTVVEIQGVIETAATAAGNADSQHHRFIKVVFRLEPLDFLSGSFGQFDCHLLINPFNLGELPLSWIWWSGVNGENPHSFSPPLSYIVFTAAKVRQATCPDRR